MMQVDTTDPNIVIKKVKSATLKLIVEYLEHHGGTVPPEITKPIKSAIMTEIVEDDWDANFMDRKNDEIFKIILGANYMDIRSLLHLGCAKIATKIKGKSPEEIKKILGAGEKKLKAAGV